MLLKFKAVERFFLWTDRHGRAIEIVSMVVIVFCLGYIANDFLLSKQEEDLYKNGRDLPEILYLIEQAYVDDIDVQSKMPGVFQGVLNSFDESASYIEPAPVSTHYGRLAYDRTGLSIIKTNRYPYIMGVAPGSPADKIGMRSGLYIMRIQGQATHLQNLHDIQRTLATSLEPLELSIYQPKTGNYKAFTMAGNPWQREPLKLETIEAGVQRIVLGDYALDRVDQLETLLRQVPADSSLLLDLRQSCSDGFELTQALAKIFLPKGSLGYFQAAKDQQIAKTNPRDGWFTGPDLFLLVNHTTGGGAEAFAALAKQRERCPVIGEQTLGKPFLYEDVPLDGRGYLRMATNHFMLVEADDFHNKGLTPNHELEAEALKDDGLAFLNEAVKVLKKQQDETVTASQEPTDETSKSSKGNQKI